MTAFLAVSLHNIPAFEALAIISVFGFCTCCFLNSYHGTWGNIKSHPRVFLLISLLGILGNDCFYLLAFRYAPPLHVDLICFLWPLVFLVTQWISKSKILYRELIAVLLAFAGIAFMLLADGSESYSSGYLFGYSMSFLSVIFWTLYLFKSKQYGKAIHEIFVLVAFAGSIVFSFMHFFYEQSVMPNRYEVISMFVIGSGGHCLAYIMWDYAVKFGQSSYISILTYAAPILSTASLIYFGYANTSMGFYVAIITLLLAIKVMGSGSAVKS
jgi:drug/metabolite transporter (DMT)-like permease